MAEHELQRLKAINAARLQASDMVDIPFRELAERCGLDAFDEDALWLLLFKAVSPGFRDQYNYCVSRAKNDWVIFLDADEEISPELAKEIEQRLSNDNDRYDGYIAHRRNYYLGRWIMHGGWVPDCEIRLFKKSSVPSYSDRHSF